MKIGIDLRVLQIGHQYRGVGEVTKQCLNRIFERALNYEDSEITFVFFEYDDEIDPKDFLDIPKDLNYEKVLLGIRPNSGAARPLPERLFGRWRNWYGATIPRAPRCDVLLQFDYALGVPRRPKTVLIAHDLIPYIFWNEFFESPWVHFRHKAARTTLRTILNNQEYIHVLKRSHKHAVRILCVSDSTRNDLHKYLHIPLKKMSVANLGVSLKYASTGKVASESNKLPTKPFLLFVGGIDGRRRRVDDLVAAYNNLKASDHDIQLVLVGENFQDPDKIPNEVVRRAVKESSYNDDILTLGYIDDKTKQMLYRKAIAFVFPTMYEGFGIPILEAMLLECPVIAYKNSSIPEVGGDFALYAKDWSDIWQNIAMLLDMPQDERMLLIAQAKQHAEAFTWEKTSEKMFDELMKVAEG